ncbi:MAG: hypothetical protein K2N06_03740 [Oscillospiraceae bacterium]|nr:hypothetical protein [Oscillospiraceae bacterium]
MKKFKKICSAIVAAMMALSISVTANAVEIDTNNVTVEYGSEVDDGYVLVLEEEFIDEDGWLITTKTYIRDTPSVQDSDRGTLSAKWEKSFILDGKFPWVTIAVMGDFSWDSVADTVTVSNAGAYWRTDGAGLKYIDDKFESASNQGKTSLFGKKYAYVKESVEVDSGQWRGDKTFTFMVDVNVLGEVHQTDSYTSR